MKIGLTVLVLFAATATAIAQDVPTNSSSLGDIARQTRARKSSKAKLVVDDDTIRSSKLPIPDIALDGDNTDPIVSAISNYQLAHNPRETEDMVHQWYDRQDSMISSAIDENRRAREHAQDRYSSYSYEGYEDESDYRRMMAQNRARNLQQRQDDRRMTDNSRFISRIAETMSRVRSRLSTMGMRYDWMVVRAEYWSH